MFLLSVPAAIFLCFFILYLYYILILKESQIMQSMKIYGIKNPHKVISYAEKFDLDVEICGLLCYI